METEYTSGPWKVKRSESKPALNIIGTALGRKYKIARCPIEDYGAKYPETNKVELIEVEANAKLIAAAPELLEALQAAPILSMYNNAESFIEAYERWRDNIKSPAIKKATE